MILRLIDDFWLFFDEKILYFKVYFLVSMVETVEGVLVWPSKPPAELEGRLGELKRYASLAKVPLALLSEVRDGLLPDQVLACWVRRDFVGRSMIYSIEYGNAAVVTRDVHGRNPRAYDARLVQVYSSVELGDLLSNSP